MTTLRGHVRCMRLFSGGKVSEPLLHFVDDDARAPHAAAAIKRNAEKRSICSAGLRPSLVLAVLGSRCIPEVLPFAVRWASVQMVNFRHWPFAGHVKPCKAVRKVLPPVYPDHEVSVASAAAGRIPASLVVVLEAPNPRTSIWRVVEQLLQSLLCTGCFHARQFNRLNMVHNRRAEQ